MAINLNTQYPGRTAGTNTNYPYGQGRNVTTQGDGTGTPFESAWFNDVYGFLQALLQGASLTPTGTPDTARSSQYLQALQALLLTQTTGDARYLNESSNLSDLTNTGTARNNLGLGNAAQLTTGDTIHTIPFIGSPEIPGLSAVMNDAATNANGRYVRFTNGLIVQWGEANETNSRNFPIPFNIANSVTIVATWNTSAQGAGSAPTTANVINGSSFRMAVGTVVWKSHELASHRLLIQPQRGDPVLRSGASRFHSGRAVRIR